MWRCHFFIWMNNGFFIFQIASLKIIKHCNPLAYCVEYWLKEEMNINELANITCLSHTLPYKKGFRINGEIDSTNHQLILALKLQQRHCWLTLAIDISSNSKAIFHLFSSPPLSNVNHLYIPIITSYFFEPPLFDSINNTIEASFALNLFRPLSVLP